MADMLQFQNKGKPKTDSGKATKKTSPSRRYSSDEVADIIRLGLQSEAVESDNTVDHDELLSIAREVGVDDSQVDQAVRLLENQRHTKDKENQLWFKFKVHAFAMLGVNIICLTINLLTGVTNLWDFWVGWVMLGTGISVLINYLGLRYAPRLVENTLDIAKSVAATTYQDLFDDQDDVSFTIEDFSKIAQTAGVVLVQDESLVIEYQTSDGIVGLLKSRIKEIEIPLTDIVSVKLEQKFWGANLVLHGRKMSSLQNLPGSNGARRLRLKIDNRSRVAASRLADTANDYIQSYK